MKEINPIFLDELISPLIGLADDDTSIEEFSGLSADDTLIRNRLLPDFMENLRKSRRGVSWRRLIICHGRMVERNL